MSSPEHTITDPGVKVATGDPEGIAAAGRWHSAVAEKLEAHSALLKSTASVLLKGWTGEASKQYQDLTREISGHYEVTAAEAHAVANALKRFSAELGSAQGEGRVALKNAVHYMNEVNHWHNKMAAAQEAKVAAEAKVKTAMQAVVAAEQAGSQPHASPGAAAAVAQSRTALHEERAALAKVQNEETTASKHMVTAADHFTMWQKKGGRALQDAEKAAGVAGLALGAVAISAPPLAGPVNAAVEGVSGSVSASVFWGLSASGRGGSSLANWEGLLEDGFGAEGSAGGHADATGVYGEASGRAFAGEYGKLTGNVGWAQLGATGTAEELAGAEAKGNARGQIGLTGIEGEAGGSAFAGVSASASGAANVGPWSASGEAGVSAGIGAEGKGSVDVSAHKIGISWKLGLTLGVGGHVSGSLSFDPSKALHDADSWGHDAAHAGDSAWHDVTHDAKSAWDDATSWL